LDVIATNLNFWLEITTGHTFGYQERNLKREVENQNETGGTGNMKTNVFKCRRNSAHVGVQVLAGLGYVILEARDAADEESNFALPVR
jgi:hypothetical protein